MPLFNFLKDFFEQAPHYCNPTWHPNSCPSLDRSIAICISNCSAPLQNLKIQTSNLQNSSSILEGRMCVKRSDDSVIIVQESGENIGAHGLDKEHLQGLSNRIPSLSCKLFILQNDLYLQNCLLCRTGEGNHFLFLCASGECLYVCFRHVLHSIFFELGPLLLG